MQNVLLHLSNKVILMIHLYVTSKWPSVFISRLTVQFLPTPHLDSSINTVVTVVLKVLYNNIRVIANVQLMLFTAAETAKLVIELCMNFKLAF